MHVALQVDWYKSAHRIDCEAQKGLMGSLCPYSQGLGRFSSCIHYAVSPTCICAGSLPEPGRPRRCWGAWLHIASVIRRAATNCNSGAVRLYICLSSTVLRSTDQDKLSTSCSSNYLTISRVPIALQGRDADLASLRAILPA